MPRKGHCLFYVRADSDNIMKSTAPTAYPDDTSLAATRQGPILPLSEKSFLRLSDYPSKKVVQGACNRARSWYNEGMSNTTHTVKNPSASNKKAPRPVGRPPVILTTDTWSLVTDALASKARLADLADTAEVSVPTMRRLLAEQFGDRVVFERGRAGGVTLMAARRKRRK